jgi:hypothetical protein
MEPKEKALYAMADRKALTLRFKKKKIRIALIAIIVLIALLYLVHETGIGSLHKKMPPLLLTSRERSPSRFLDSMRTKYILRIT